jgi:D-3-phosphoglycerate dehydrogenase / 2-oxoglutarate reductase
VSNTLTDVETKTMTKTGKPRVLITDGINPVACDLFGDTCEVDFRPKLSADELLEAVKGADALMVRSASQVTEAVFKAAPNLKIVGRAGVGTDNIDLKAATRNGVIVVNSPDGNTEAAAEHTIAMIFAMCRHIPEADAIVKGGGWRSNALTGVELFNRTLGVVGFGKIGQRVAKVFQALGMTVLVYDPFLSQHQAETLKVQPVDMPTLFEKSDVITLHAPKTPETANLLNAEAFAKMKPGVRIVNCARGGIIDEQALADALNSGKVAKAALDVFAQEPINSENPLLGLGHKVILTPHLGASTEEAQLNVAVDVAEQIKQFFEEGVAKHAVNIPAFRKHVLDPVKAYLPLAEWMGQFVRQIAKGGAVSLEIVSSGTLAKEDISPVTLAAMKGLISVSREGVNYVNAKVMADEMDMTIKESRSDRCGNYTNLLTLNLVTDKETHSLSGTLISDNLFQLTSVDGYPAAITPSPYALVTPHQDKPGMIAKVSSVLGSHNINISGMQVARKAGHSDDAGGESLMIFNLDNPVPDDVAHTIEALEGINKALFLAF